MAVLNRLLISSAERLDLPDFLSIDSYAAGDWKYFIKSLIGGSNSYILKGFDVIDPGQSIGSTNIAIKVADSALYHSSSNTSSFFYGLEEGNVLAQPLVPELRKNAINYIYITLSTVDTTQDTRSFWDPDKEGGAGGEFTQDVNTASTIIVNINTSVSTFPEGTTPVCKVVMSEFIEEITDCRDLMFRLAQGGMQPNSYGRYSFKELPTASYARLEPSLSISNPLNPNPFQGGDKNIATFKEWMDVVMTKLLELSGTSYWYEDTSLFNMINMFSDLAMTSVRSKGTWLHSSTIPGNLAWSEDFVIQSLNSNKDYIVRAGNVTLNNNELLYMNVQRDLPINNIGYQVKWFNSVNHVNGSVGAFANLKKGDWVKKTSDKVNLYLRVEEFYLAPNKGGGITTPSNAQSIKLSGLYGGETATSEAIYCKGSYLASELTIADRSASQVTDTGGNVVWLAFRSDTIMKISSIYATLLTLNVESKDGIRAKVTCTNNDQTATNEHMLSDGESITISSSTNFNGTYVIEKESDSVFYINVSVAATETVNGYYGIATTTTRSTSDGYLLESSSHCFETGSKVAISGTSSSWDGSRTIFARNATSFSFPLSLSIAPVSIGLATAAKVYIKTEIGSLRILQGETKYVGEAETENIQQFIGMSSLTQTHPIYNISGAHSMLNGSENYNSNENDSLTSRVSKLTAMMADKSQDRNIKFAPVFDACINTTSGSDKVLSFIADSGTPILYIAVTSSYSSASLSLSGNITLANNTAAYFTLDRNNTFNIDLSDLIVVAIDSVPLNENVVVVAYRVNDIVCLWDNKQILDGYNESLTSITSRTLLPNIGAYTNTSLNSILALIDVDSVGLLAEIDKNDINFDGSTFTWSNALRITRPVYGSHVISAGSLSPLVDGDIVYTKLYNPVKLTSNGNLAGQVQVQDPSWFVDNDMVLIGDNNSVKVSGFLFGNPVGSTLTIDDGLGTPIDLSAYTVNNDAWILKINSSMYKSQPNVGDLKPEIISSTINKFFIVGYKRGNSLYLTNGLSIQKEWIYEEATLLLADVMPGDVITLPLDSKNGDAIKYYNNFSGQLEVTLNGETLNSDSVTFTSFTPTSYNIVTGQLLLPNAANLTNVRISSYFIDSSNNEFPILGGINNTNGNKCVYLDTGLTVDTSSICYIRDADFKEVGSVGDLVNGIISRRYMYSGDIVKFRVL